MKVYYINNHYPEKRCIIRKVVEGEYIPLAAVVENKTLKTLVEKLQHSFAHRFSRFKGEKTLSGYWLLKRDGIVHTFNSCIYGRNKWCATFETILPRTNFTRAGMSEKILPDRLTVKQFKLLAKENCIGCMALSQATFNRQMNALNMMKRYLSDKEIECIRNKTHVVHPPQELLVTREDVISKFASCNELELMFVGHDFFRKGGKELIDCLLEYRNNMVNVRPYILVNNRRVHLTVVSCMNYGDYASHASREEMLRYKHILENEKWITFYEKLTNEQVLELCKTAHIGLLPTLADTYGYSVLEMQACGCAMVTTDIRSLPEINNPHCGWICCIPQDERKEALYQTEENRVLLKNTLKNELKTQLDIVFHSEQKELTEKALNSWERIRTYHNPIDYSNKLKTIWDEK